MADEERKDTVLTLYLDILREIEINEEYRKTGNVKAKIDAAKRELRNILKATTGYPRKDRIAFTRQPRNLLRMLEGKDYYFTISDGFEVYTIKKSTIEKKGDQVTAYILDRFRKNVNAAIKEAKADKKMAQQVKDKKLDALERLKVNIRRNIDIVKARTEYVYDDYWMNKINDEAYPIFQDVTGLSIRINV